MRKSQEKAACETRLKQIKGRLKAISEGVWEEVFGCAPERRLETLLLSYSRRWNAIEELCGKHDAALTALAASGIAQDEGEPEGLCVLYSAGYEACRRFGLRLDRLGLWDGDGKVSEVTAQPGLYAGLEEIIIEDLSKLPKGLVAELKSLDGFRREQIRNLYT